MSIGNKITEHQDPPPILAGFRPPSDCLPAAACRRPVPQTLETIEVSSRRGSEEERSQRLKMCPLRIILVFLSATLAGYFAWKNVMAAGVSPFDEDTSELKSIGVDLPKKNGSADMGKLIGNGFWTFVDMASGRYLWRNLKTAKES